MAWGDPDERGVSKPVRTLPYQGVHELQQCDGICAGILANGSVLCWGRGLAFDEYSSVRDQLHNVREVQATHSAFAAIRSDGLAVTWGGAYSREVQAQLRNVQHIQSSMEAFAAILADGSVIAWGDPDFGGDCQAVQDQLQDVQHIQASNYSFAALRGDGSVVTWGAPDGGGDSSTEAGLFSIILCYCSGLWAPIIYTIGPKKYFFFLRGH